MRNFEERKTEIFRRSEKIISQNRKKRNTIVACVSLFAVVSIFSLALIPEMNSNEEAGNSPVPETTTSSVRFVKAQVKAYDGSLYKQFDDQNTVSELAELLEQAANTNENQTGSGTSETDNVVNESDDSEPVYNKSHYMIVLTDGYGNQITYFLNGKTLIQKTSGEIFILSENQMRTLKYICGLP